MAKQQRWMNLCEQAENKNDPQKLADAVAKIDRTLVSKVNAFERV
jgi:hypothetical protein